MATNAKRNSHQSNNLLKALTQGERPFRSLIEKSFDAIVLLDGQGVLLYASPSIERLLGYAPDELLGRNAFTLIHPDDREKTMGVLAALLEQPGTSKIVNYRAQHKDGTIVWMEAIGTNLLQDPTLGAIVTNFRDITERKQTEERLHLLNEASRLLATSLDHQITLQEIAYLIVPALADYCRIAIVDEQQQITDIAAHHVHQEQLALVRSLYEQYKDRTATTHGVQRLLETGEPELISSVSGSVLQSVQDNPELLAIVQTLGLKSYMGVPLIARERVIGAITFSSIQPHRRYTHDDLVFAQELAQRIALALDNARLYQQAQKAIALRDDFISIASHELKTPVTSLKMYTQVLHRQFTRQGEENLVGFLAKMDIQITKLTALIDDLLDISKIELGQLEFREEAFDLNEVVKDAVEQVQPTTAIHTIHTEGSINQPVWGDKDRIGQVLTNLLTNAIKYSPDARSIIVRLTPAPDAALVTVQDFGIGIAEEHQNKLFTRFYRVSDPEERTYPGLGIGLYLSHEIIKRHGGTMQVESEKGKGSQFSFTLPYMHSPLITA